MQSANWISFCASHAIGRSVLHFFPASENASAPYTAFCEVGVFGPGIEPYHVTLDGARLGHPDGVRLEDAFPALKAGFSGFIGVEIEITTPQPRIDVDASECFIEVLFQGLPVRFPPRKVYPPRLLSAPSQASTDFDRASTFFSGFVAKDEFLESSLIVVNGGESPLVCQLLTPAKDGQNTALGETEVEGRSVVEIPITLPAFENVPAQELSWGSQRLISLTLEATEFHASPSQSGKTSDDLMVAPYAVFRDPVTKRLVSVIPLQKAAARVSAEETQDSMEEK